MEKSKLHKKIMRRVYFIYLLQRAFSPRMMKLGFFSLSVVGLASAVSIGNVIANMPTSDPGAFAHFFLTAFTHTTVIVQVLTLAALAGAAWYGSDLFKRGRSISPAFS